MMLAELRRDKALDARNRIRGVVAKAMTRELSPSDVAEVDQAAAQAGVSAARIDEMLRLCAQAREARQRASAGAALVVAADKAKAALAAYEKETDAQELAKAKAMMADQSPVVLATGQSFLPGDYADQVLNRTAACCNVVRDRQPDRLAKKRAAAAAAESARPILAARTAAYYAEVQIGDLLKNL